MIVDRMCVWQGVDVLAMQHGGAAFARDRSDPRSPYIVSFLQVATRQSTSTMQKAGIAVYSGSASPRQ